MPMAKFESKMGVWLLRRIEGNREIQRVRNVRGRENKKVEEQYEINKKRGVNDICGRL